ncbi:MAG: choice-of-anchor L domain-containing protein, partial [Lutibacter sp.]|nr:choice-of-anchor L domain-containing protein [Lutibacter sp.]
MYTPQELVEEVLISGDCAQVDLFSTVSNGAPTDNENKSYGYFKRPPGSNFPFEEGIILTSGKAFSAGNNVDTNDLDNDNSLAGDSDLELALGQTSTADATFVKFQFTPISTSISFRYLMASEEYNQNFECTFADAFAFLLRPVGSTTYTNLAVIPETNTPVSTMNVRPLVPGACAAVNEAYFEGYNLGDTNYGGRTKVLTASAAVIPNQPYEIKLVIADQDDSQFDSAVFLEAGSFVLNADLGAAKLYTTNNAACGGAFLLDASIVADSYKWYKDGVLIPGESGQTYNATLGNGIYKVEATLSAGCIAEDEIELQFTTEVTATKPTDFALCDEDNNGSIAFDLSLKTPDIELGQSDVSTTYHGSQADADNDLNPLAMPFISGNTIIYARVESNISSNCYDTTSFELQVFESPVPEDSTDIATIERCDDTLVGTDTDGKTLFDLQIRETAILNGQSPSQFALHYYKDQAHTQLISDPGNFENTVPGGQTIFVQMYNIANNTCVASTSLDLVVNPLPVIKNPLVKVEQCDLNVFNLSSYQQELSQGHLNETFQYQNADGDIIADPTNYTSPYSSASVSETIDVLITTVDGGCSRTAQIELKVGISQIPPGFSPLERFLCETDPALSQDGKMFFDKAVFTQIQNELETAQPLFLTPGTEFSFFRSEQEALLQNNPIDTAVDFQTGGTFFDTAFNRWEQPIWVYIENTNIEEITCFGKGQVASLYVEKRPIAHAVIFESLCDDQPMDTEFSTEFDTSTLEDDLLQGQSNTTVSYWDEMGNPLMDLQGNLVTSPFPASFRTLSQTIIARVTNNSTNTDTGPCEDETEIVFTVDTTPVAFPVSMAAVCDDDLDGDDT